MTTSVGASPSDLHRAVARELTLLLSDRMPAPPNLYVTHYLADHVAEADDWEFLADHDNVLDLLDPSSVAAQVLRTALGRKRLPAEIAGIVGARHQLSAIAPGSRTLIRMIAAARHTGEPQRFPTLPDGQWRVKAIRVPHRPLNILLDGHEAPVEALAVLRPPGDGPILLASGDRSGVVRLWDPATGQPVGAGARLHAEWITALCPVVVGDELRLATASHDHTVCLTDPSSGSEIHTFEGHDDRVEALVAYAAADGKTMLASAGRDGTVRLWNPETLKPAGVLRDPDAGGLKLECLAAVEASRGRMLLASGGDDHVIRVWDPEQGTLVHKLSGHISRIYALAVIRSEGSESVLVSGSSDGTIKLWDPSLGALLEGGGELAGESVENLEPVKVSNDRVLLAVGTTASVVHLLHPYQGVPMGEPLAGHEDQVKALASIELPDGRRLLASGGIDRQIRLWDPNGSLLHHPAPRDLAAPLTALVPLTTEDGRLLFAGATDIPLQSRRDSREGRGARSGMEASSSLLGQFAAIQLWDVDAQPANPNSTPLLGHKSGVRALTPLRLASGKTVLASGGDDYLVRIWDVTTGEQTTDPLVHHDLWVNALCPVKLPDGRPGLASGSRDRTVCLWDPAEGTLVGEPLAGHAASVVALAEISRNGAASLLASGDDGGTVLLWTVNDSRSATVLNPVPHAAVTALCAIEPRGRGAMLAVGGRDGALRIWDPWERILVAEEPRAHVGPLTSVTALIRSGRSQFVSGGADGAIRFWDAETGKHQYVYMVDFPVVSVAALGYQTGDRPSTLLAVAGKDTLLILGARS